MKSLLLSKKKPRMIIVFFVAVGISFLYGIGIYLYQRSKSQEKECLLKQRYLWSAARSYRLEHGISYKEKIDIDDLISSYFNSSNVSTVSSSGTSPGAPFSASDISICLSGTSPYPSFSYFEGPVCPNGHQLLDKAGLSLHQKTCKIESLGKWTTNSKSPPPVQALLEETKHKLPKVRKSAVQSLGCIFSRNRDPKILEIIQNIAKNDEDPRVRKYALKVIKTGGKPFVIKLSSPEEEMAHDFLSKGDRLYEDQRYTEAVEMYRKALKYDTNCVSARKHLKMALKKKRVGAGRSVSNLNIEHSQESPELKTTNKSDLIATP